MRKEQALEEYRRLELERKEALEKNDTEAFAEVRAQQEMIKARFPELLRPPKFH